MLNSQRLGDVVVTMTHADGSKSRVTVTEKGDRVQVEVRPNAPGNYQVVVHDPGTFGMTYIGPGGSGGVDQVNIGPDVSGGGGGGGSWSRGVGGGGGGGK